MAESERLDSAQPQQNDELKQLHSDEGDKNLDGGGEVLEPVVDDDGDDKKEGGGEGEDDCDDEGGEDETRCGELSKVVVKVEEGADSLSSRLPEEKESGNLGAVAPSTVAAAVSENDHCVGSVEDSAPEARTEAQSKEQVGSSEQEVSACKSPQDAKAETENRLQLRVCPPPASELSPTSVTQPISADASPTVPEKQRLPLSKDSSGPVQEADQLKPSDTRKLVIPPLKTAIPDGYKWRKYGQKQVKRPNGSRSYYRCTHSGCFAKKIECSDHCGHVIEIVNKGMHSHDPPWKSNSKKASRRKESDPAMLSKEPTQEKFVIADRKHLSPSGSSESDAGQIEMVCVSDPKKRMKISELEYSGQIKPRKKPKFVVHAAGDVGISADGYRWRKYGQKMVKGSSHPRNYYRCTSAGCPVRKHTETAADNSRAVIITYTGVHDHDMPVPKKRHGPPSAPLVAAAAAAASMSNNAMLQQNKRTEPPPRKPETSVSGGGDNKRTRRSNQQRRLS